jgi:glycosyltransferase involved in cell wall biosynthesis
MTSVVIGVHVHAEPARLRATLAALDGLDVLLLPDGPDAETLAALAALPKRQDATAVPLGPPACFNRLARAADADVIVLLESGCLPHPGWLGRLLDALAADRRNGLAGPSTNLAWNQQATTAEAAARAGDEVRSLAPLHGLADFCLAVKREVLDAVGAADEGFGLGPCWEMEYSARALRAGYRGVWACGAYVHRSPFTERRRREEAARFDASRRRYQDAVCALRLRGDAGGYQPHCRGEDCEHFAPAGLMRIHRPLAPPASIVAVSERVPLVSCIMPTCERPDFALQAIRYFQRQDYAPRELVIVDESDGELEARLPDDPRIRYLRGPAGESIGAKRNRACAAARGEYVIHWDDDDWFAPDRVRRQMEPFLAGAADISALRAGVFLELERWVFWRCSDDLHRRMFVEDVHGSTLAYRRALWASIQFPGTSLAEDAWFLHRALRRGARLARLDNAGSFVYVRHGANAWRFRCGDHVDAAGWAPAEEPPLPPADRAFYAERSPAAPAGRLPLVSCVMPTAGRAAFVELALRYFLRQDYPARELIVVDDGRASVAHLMPDDERVRYTALESVLGAKRNHACALARGELIVHWDDDDWMAPDRLRRQVVPLLDDGADVCGAASLLYLDRNRRRAWRYAYPRGRRRWVTGNTLCFTRESWERDPFPEVRVGEDTRFVWSERSRRLLVLEDDEFLVGLIHDANASPKNTGDPWWSAVALERVERVLGDDARAYLQQECHT